MADQVMIYKLDAEGHLVLSYPGQVVMDDGERLVARCRYASKETACKELVFQQGDILLECYYRSQPFNIWVVYTPQGRLKGWYCNVVERTAFRPGTIEWTDLALDLLILPDGRQFLLDEDEFEALLPSPGQREQAHRALKTLRHWHAQGVFPFHLAG